MKRHRTRTDARDQSDRHGFTLIELLVVIAIISLLVSILLPSLAKAKDLAKAAMCASQTRNLALAFLVYREEWEFLPWPWSKVYPLGYGGSVYTLNMFVVLELEEKHGLDSINAYTCPAGDRPPRRWWDSGHGPPEPWDPSCITNEMFFSDDYCVYTYLDTNAGKWEITLADDAPVATHDNLSSEYAMVGCTALLPSLPGYSAWNNHQRFTSYEGFNTAYSDAHVEWTSTPDDFYDDKNTAQYYSNQFYFWWK